MERWKLSIKSHWLLLLAGVAWSAIGTTLCAFAIGWLQQSPLLLVMPLALAGLVLALFIYRLGFSKLALKNIGRICAMTGMFCPTAFQSRKSYLTSVVMIGVGFMLRNSPIPKPDLAVLYIGIGGGLLLSSFHYYARLIQIVAPKSLAMFE